MRRHASALKASWTPNARIEAVGNVQQTTGWARGIERTDTADGGSKVTENGCLRITHLAFDTQLGLHVDIAADGPSRRDEEGREDEDGGEHDHAKHLEEQVHEYIHDPLQSPGESVIDLEYISTDNG